ncbi:MAG: serpin family protein [Nakamurella sp.]
MSSPTAGPKLLPRRAFLALTAALGAGLLVGCGSTAGTPTAADDQTSDGNGPTGSNKTSIQELGGGEVRMAAAPQQQTTGNLCRFAAELFQASAPGTKNAVISPYSVLAALGMAELGAQGGPLAAITKVLGGEGKAVAGQVTAVDAAIAKAIAASQQASSGQSGTTPAVVSPANALFVQNGTTLQPAFLKAVSTGYGAGVFTTDYQTDPEAARQQINGWVSEKTHELIPALLERGSVTPLWRLALVNALYLKAQWSSELTKAGEKTPFVTAAGNTVSVEQLHGSGRHLNYAKGSGWQAASLPYLGDALAMTILLPDAGAFGTVTKALDGPTLSAACSGADTPVDFSIPGFKTDFAIDLTDPLKGLGMAPAFDAPMPGIGGGGESLEIKKVIHQARISVDEHGTEAAAATVVAVGVGAAPSQPETPIDFTVDRPFLYFIHDTTTKCPLFLGRVTDPTS